MNRSKWDINKVETKASKFGTGSHIITPAAWSGKTIVAMLKTKWDELQKIFLLGITIPLVLLLLPHNAFAWGWGPSGWFNQGFQGFHHWGFHGIGSGGCSA